MEYIGYVYNDFPEKFGLPRQSGLVPSLKGIIEFVHPYGQKEAFYGLEDFDYIWILFEFDEAKRDRFCATVKPPKLGGNKHMGVFATRSPFRPNSIGLTSAKLDSIEYLDNTVKLHVSGIDIKNGTPVLDIKPYLPYADSHEGVRAGFTDDIKLDDMKVEFEDGLIEIIPEDKIECLIDVLRQNPRPGYHDDDNKVYGMYYMDKNIRFVVNRNNIKVIAIEEIKK